MDSLRLGGRDFLYFRVAPNTISLIINEVCDAIKAEFAAEVIQCPTTTEDWTLSRPSFSSDP
jgi:hypothetical protein